MRLVANASQIMKAIIMVPTMEMSEPMEEIVFQSA